MDTNFISLFVQLITIILQVQLLVSNDDVKNYRQIDRDLFILKILTEKSELWIQADRTRSESSSNQSFEEHSSSLDDSSKLLFSTFVCFQFTN